MATAAATLVILPAFTDTQHACFQSTIPQSLPEPQIPQPMHLPFSRRQLELSPDQLVIIRWRQWS